MNIKLAYFLFIASFALMILSIVSGFTDGKFNYFGIISNILLIISTGYNIYYNNKKK